MNDITPVILFGGSGSRLSPMSASAYPKQFFALTSELTLIQETALRVSGGRFPPPIVIGNEERRFPDAEQLRVIGRGAAEIGLGGAACNTAAAIAAATLRVKPVSPNGPSDHSIPRLGRLFEAIDPGCAEAVAGGLDTFGVAPARRLIEVQSDSFRGEDDIVRLEDGYTPAPDTPLAEMTPPADEDDRRNREVFDAWLTPSIRQGH